MGNSKFECEELFSDDENNISLHTENTGSKDSSVQCDKVVDGYGKAPRFRKKSCASQPPSNKICEGHDSRNSFTSSQPSVGSPRSQSQGASQPSPASPKPQSQGPSQPSPGSPKPQSQGPPRSGQDLVIPSFDSKDKLYWYREFKREKALNRKLNKRLERSTTRYEDFRKQVKVLSELLN